MKSEAMIKIILSSLEKDVRIQSEIHSNLHQIDKLSGEGSTVRKNIAAMNGKIDALKWVLL